MPRVGAHLLGEHAILLAIAQAASLFFEGGLDCGVILCGLLLLICRLLELLDLFSEILDFFFVLMVFLLLGVDHLHLFLGLLLRVLNLLPHLHDLPILILNYTVEFVLLALN